METSELKKKRKLPWWVKWFGIPLLIVAIFVAAWCSWYFHAWTEFNKEVDALKASGQPTTWGDMIPPHVPDEDNALVAYRQAADIYEADLSFLAKTIAGKMKSDDKLCSSECRCRLDAIGAYQNSPDLRKAYPFEMRQLMHESNRTFAKCIEAANKRSIYWSLEPSFVTAQDWTISPLSHFETLSRFLSLKVIVLHEQKDDLAEIQGLYALFNIPDTLSSLYPSPDTLTSTITTQSIATSTVEDVSCTLLSDDSPNEKAKAEIRSLINCIINETNVASGHISAWQGGRILLINLIRNGELHESLRRKAWRVQKGPLGPRYLSEAKTELRNMRFSVNAAAETNFPAFKKTLAAWPSYPRLNLAGQDCLLYGSRDCLFFGELYFHSLARRRMAAIALAIRLYELDHGKRPETLTQLVPNYLPHVPSDPFEATGKPIQYLPKAKYPRLYSVGVDGIDESGKYADDLDSPPVHNKFDLPFFLTPNKPREKIQKTNTEN